ncbi:serine protease [Verrucomicrobiales bacterium BCK34]|nr:serine protease [Verrucomicrobiales bacterium BCK34]
MEIARREIELMNGDKTNVRVFADIVKSLSILVFLFCGISGKVRAGVPANNLNYPVLIEAATGLTGSGFFLEAGRSIYLVTARHVIDPGKESGEITVYAQTSNHGFPDRLKLILDPGVLHENGHVLVHRGRDVVAIRIGKMKGEGDFAPLVYHEGVALSQKGTLTAVAEVNTVSFQDIGVTNRVYVMGYPVSVGVASAKQLDHRTPLVRTGIVAGKNLQDGVVILDCQVDGGNSGGPVIQMSEDSKGMRHYHVIGMVSEFVPSAEEWISQSRGQVAVNISNSGYSVVEPMDSIWQLIQFPELSLSQDSGKR